MKSEVSKMLGFARLSPIYRAQPPFITRDVSTSEERRHEHITVDDQGKVVFLVTTKRQDETVRIISLRRTHPGERETFSVLTGFSEDKNV